MHTDDIRLFVNILNYTLDIYIKIRFIGVGIFVY